MSAPFIAARYAEALFGLAQERQKIGELRQELAEVVQLVDASSDLRELLERPDLSAQRKIAALEATLSERFSRDLVSALATMVNHERGDAVAMVREAFDVLADRTAGVVVAEAATVVPLTDEQRGRLIAVLQRMTGQQVRLNQRIEPEVVAGVRLTVGDRLIDGSAAGRLARMREELIR